MNDVLPKPFTRQSLLSMLEKHLIHLIDLLGRIMAQKSTTQSVKSSLYQGQQNRVTQRATSPVSTTNSINPMNSKPVVNISYFPPPKDLDPSDSRCHYLD